MLPNNSLEDRLNAVKNGDTPPVPVNHDEVIMNALAEIHETEELQKQQQKKENKTETVAKAALETIGILIASALYGYAMRAVFSTDWIFVETIGVGFLLNHALTLVNKGFSKFFKK